MRACHGFRTCRSVLAAVASLALVGAGVTQAQTHRYEAETAQLLGVRKTSSGSGYSGTGYVTGFDAADGSDRVRWEIDVPTGAYELWVGYRSAFGPKGYNFRVDAVSGSGMFEAAGLFSVDRAGLVSVRPGVNSLEISQGWGYYDVDYLEFRPFVPPTLLPVAPALVDDRATYAARVLMNYLGVNYGVKTLAGQQHSASANLPFPGDSYLQRSAGASPAVRGSDFMEYSPSRRQYGANPRNETEQSIAWARQTGGVVTMMWHWNAPANLVNQTGKEWWRGFYANATTFNLPAALANPASSDYQLLLRDIDAIAVELKKFAAADVPVLWRPLHEAQGGWFWWGAHGPATFKSLWTLLHDRLTQRHGLHNLIWEFTSSAAEGNHLDWYPGDELVDLIGLDVYTDPTANMAGPWHDVLPHYNGRKMVALSETGTLPRPEEMADWGISWSYFSPWSGSYVDGFTAEQLQTALHHDNVVTLAELPPLPWKASGGFVAADLDFDGHVDDADFARWATAWAANPYGDIDGNAVTGGADLLAWQRQFRPQAGPQTARTVPEPPAARLLPVLAAAFPRRARARRPIRLGPLVFALVPLAACGWPQSSAAQDIPEPDASSRVGQPLAEAAPGGGASVESSAPSAAAAASPWQTLREEMRRAAAALRAGDASGAASGAQGAAIAQLQRLAPSPPTAVAAAAASAGQAAAGETREMPGNEGFPEDSAAAPLPGLAASRALLASRLRGEWGGLPERASETLLQPLAADYLPRYEADIAAYFRALARPEPLAAEGAR